MDSLGGDGCGDTEKRETGRGRGRGFWMPQVQEVEKLRRPHHAVTGNQDAGSNNMKHTDESNECLMNPSMSTESIYEHDIRKISRLSIEAPVFVPRNPSLMQPVVPRNSSPMQSMGPRNASPMQPMQSSVSIVPKHTVQDRIQLARETPNSYYMPHYYDSDYDNSQSAQQQQEQQQLEQVDQYENVSQENQNNQYITPEMFDDYEDFGEYENDNQVFMFNEKGDNQGSGEEAQDLSMTMQQLLDAIHTLILKPGLFNCLVPLLINSMRPHLKYPNDFQKIMKKIIQQSVNEDNFRYTGARLCTSFHTAVSSSEQVSFRDILYSLCKEETQSQIINWQQKNEHTDVEQKQCHGLILFLAELIVQLENDHPFGLGELLVQLITIVLKKPAPNSAKHICQALKLAGQTLEKDESGIRKEMENMMRALTELVTTGRVDSHIGNMVNSVHELRKGNWGRNTSISESIPSSDVEQPKDTPQVLREPVFYGPDGKVLSAEESKFLQDLVEDTSDFDDNADSEHKFDISKEDDELMAAYEEFLKLLPDKAKNKVY